MTMFEANPSLHRFSLTVLCLSAGALVAAGVGLTLLWDPMILAPVQGLTGPLRTEYANEARSPAGLLLISAALMLRALWHPAQRAMALWTMTAVYLGYGLSRVASILADGAPSSSLQTAMWIELALGTMALLCALRLPSDHR